jgi:hypothetical protein
MLSPSKTGYTWPSYSIAGIGLSAIQHVCACGFRNGCYLLYQVLRGPDLSQTFAQELDHGIHVGASFSPRWIK